MSLTMVSIHTNLDSWGKKIKNLGVQANNAQVKKNQYSQAVMKISAMHRALLLLKVASGWASIDGGSRERRAGQSWAFLSKLANLFSQKDVSTGD